MKPRQLAELEASSSLAWIALNNFKTERGDPIEFTEHRWAIDYLTDEHPHKVSPKAAQAGMTVLEFMDDFYLCGVRGMEVAHTFHTTDILQKIVRPKVNPLILNNPKIRAMMTVDSEGLKGFNKSFLHIIGANAESNAISFSADVLKIDEKDRSNLTVVEMLESRLKFSKFKWVREFSNPSAINYGVDIAWRKSDMRHWFVRCPHCNHYWFIDFEKSDTHNHYVDQERLIYACGKCDRELPDEARIRGEWVAAYASRDQIHGYWISQLMCAWISAKEVVKDYQDKSTEYFHNFVLGKAYTPADMLIDRDTVIQALRQGQLRTKNVVMGSDIGKPHWYWLATPAGLFKCGRASSWDELEYLFNFYDCDAWVMDSMPEFTKVQEMLRKYPGRAFACQFNKDRAALGAIRWQEGDKRGFVYADRTKVIDRTVTDLASSKLPIYLPLADVEEFIKHAGNMYRTIETDTKGAVKIDWQTTEGRPDHLVFALVYTRIALEKVFSGVGAGVVDVDEQTPGNSPTVVDGKIAVNFDIDKSLAMAKDRVSN